MSQSSASYQNRFPILGKRFCQVAMFHTKTVFLYKGKGFVTKQCFIPISFPYTRGKVLSRSNASYQNRFPILWKKFWQNHISDRNVFFIVELRIYIYSTIVNKIEKGQSNLSFSHPAIPYLEKGSNKT